MSTSLLNVDRRNPVNRSEPSNAGLLAAWQHLPGWSGGATLRNLSGPDPATLLASSRWSNVSPSGGIGSIYCDGSAACGLKVADRAIFTLTSFTASIWFRPANTANYQCLMVHGTGDGAHRDWGLFLVAGSASQLYFTAQGSNVGPIGITPGYVVGAWNHVALSCSQGDVGGAVVNICINGVLAYNNPSVISSGATVGHLSIGNEIGAGSAEGFPFTGHLASPTLWTVARSVDQMARRYQLERRGFPGIYNRSRSPLYGVSSAAAFRPWFLRGSSVLGSGVY